MSSLPSTIGTWSNLTIISVSNNSLTVLPDSIRNLTKLRLLNLSYNRLTTLPDFIGDLVNLEHLDFSDNQIGSIPVSFNNLVKWKLLIGDYDMLDQKITLPAKELVGSTFILTSPINALGELVLPDPSLAGEYTVDGNDITWNNLTKDTNSVSFSFDTSIQIAGQSRRFSGTAIQPLMHDLTAPPAPIVNQINGGAEVVINGNGEAKTVINIIVNKGTTKEKPYSCTTDADGNFSIIVDKLQENDSVSVSNTDLAGNISPTTDVIVPTSWSIMIDKNINLNLTNRTATSPIKIVPNNNMLPSDYEHLKIAVKVRSDNGFKLISANTNSKFVTYSV
ncbi:hypothetical protein AZF37_09270 [endosymbiont 'TC1' of Trimyema compressum]|nr:hypothetical protein AZF37_09270 [endosymbiont 'TC1' of Trimyema compressum]